MGIKPLDVDFTCLSEDKTKLFIVSLASRPGSHIFVMELEYHHYIPDTDSNNLFEVYLNKWEEMNWMTVQIPIKDRPIAEKVAAKYNLRFADGVPTIIDGTGSGLLDGAKQFPLLGDNVWSLEQAGGDYMDKKKEEELCDEILAQFELHRDKLNTMHYYQPVIEVNHSDLRTIPECDSAFRRFCPVCTHGVLMVQRDDTTYQLLEIDRCILCAQPFKYLDIDKLRDFDDPPTRWKAGEN